MKWIFFILSIQIVFAQDNCTELGKTLHQLETDLMSKYADKCKDLDIKVLLPNATEEQKTFFTDVRCQSLDVLESKINNIENQQTMLAGFDKLIVDIKEQKKKIEEKEPSKVHKAQKNFKDALSVAQTLEIVLSVNDKNKKPLLIRLKEAQPEERENLSAYKNFVKKICDEKKEDDPDKKLCQYFSPTDNAVSEINSIIDNNQNLDARLIAQWKKALEINKKNAPADKNSYSFTEMSEDLKSTITLLEKEELSFTKKELQAIRDLPDFEKKSGLSILEELKSSKLEVDNQATLEKFKVLSEELKERQDLNLKRTLSLAWYKFKPSNLDSKSCDIVTGSSFDLDTCMNALKDIAKKLDIGDKKTHLGQLIESAENTLLYRKKLSDLKDKCFSTSVAKLRSSAELPESCDFKLDKDQVKLGREIQVLNLLREKILADNNDLIAWRDFAAQSFEESNCAVKQVSSVGTCSDGLDHLISQNVVGMVGEGLDIIVNYSKMTDDKKTEMKKLCENKDTLKSYQLRLCDPTSRTRGQGAEIIIPKATPSTVSENNNRNLTRSALNQLMTNIATQAWNTFNPTNTNPYGTYNPFAIPSSIPIAPTSNFILNSTLSSAPLGVYFYGASGSSTSGLGKYFYGKP